MHELALTQSVLNLSLQHAQQAGAQRVLAVHLALADFAHETEDSLQFHWNLLREGTRAQTAELRIQRVLLHAHCDECGQRFAPSEEPLMCPACFSPRVTPEADLVRVESIDVE